MFISPLTAWLMGAGCLAVLVRPAASTALAWSVVVLALAALDVLLAPGASAVSITRAPLAPVRQGEQTISVLTVRATGRRALRLRVRDAWPPSAQARDDRSRRRLRAGEHVQLTTHLSPQRRGSCHAQRVTVRSYGPLGLAGRQLGRSVPGTLLVLPPFVSRRYLPSRLTRLREMDGRAPVMVRGAGTEFDSLREYVMGDDVRSIDWRSTARRGEVLVRTWRPQRDRRVVIVIDCGRSAAARLGEATRLDAEIEAALLLATLASQAGDRVDVLTVDQTVRSQVRGLEGSELARALAATLATTRPTLTETNWARAAQAVRQVASQRAAVMILAAVDAAGSMDARTLRALGGLAREHTVVVGSAADGQLEVLRRERSTSDEAYTAAAAERDLLTSQRWRDLLAGQSIRMVSCSAEQLAPAMADTYLDLKAAGQL